MDSPEKRIVDAAGIIWKDKILWDATTTAGVLFGGFVDCGKRREWVKANDILDRLYALVGAENPANKYAIQSGNHPLQVYIRERVYTQTVYNQYRTKRQVNIGGTTYR